MIAPFNRRIATRAFSLVEVTLALGIVLFGLFTVTGLLPVGLASLDETITRTTEGQIVQRIGAELRLIPYAELAALSGRTRYYDQEGELLSATGNEPPAGSRYRITFTRALPRYPGMERIADPALTAEALSLIRIEVARLAGETVLETRYHVAIIPDGGI